MAERSGDDRALGMAYLANAAHANAAGDAEEGNASFTCASPPPNARAWHC
jgi:hypothetical protein